MNIKLPKDVSHILNTLETNGYEAYIVGGSVRDSLLNRSIADYDITTKALPEDIMNIFDHTIPTGIKHGTVTVILNSKSYEVTTFRIDGEYSDNRHPDEVVFTSSLKEDLSRRDFTINALAYNEKEGLVDLFKGVEDINKGIVRCVGNPDKRFEEDALRMLRAIRFACQLNFSLEETALNSIIHNNSLLKNVSAERIREEFIKILMSPVPSKGIRLLLETGLLDYVVPELKASVGFNQRNPHHDKNVFDHIMSVLDNSTEDIIVRLGALLHDIGKPRTFTVDNKGIGHFYAHNTVSAEMTETILKRLKFDNNTIKKVQTIVREHMSAYSAMKDKALKKFIARVGTENLEELFQLQIADSKGHKADADYSPILKRREEVNNIINAGEVFTLKGLKINGEDLIKLGIAPGKDIGIMLNKLLDMVMADPKLNNRDTLLNIVRKTFNLK